MGLHPTHESHRQCTGQHCVAESRDHHHHPIVVRYAWLDFAAAQPGTFPRIWRRSARHRNRGYRDPRWRSHQRGEFAAAVELHRLFPGITDNRQARECVPHYRRLESTTPGAAAVSSPQVFGGHPPHLGLPLLAQSGQRDVTARPPARQGSGTRASLLHHAGWRSPGLCIHCPDRLVFPTRPVVHGPRRYTAAPSRDKRVATARIQACGEATRQSLALRCSGDGAAAQPPLVRCAFLPSVGRSKPAVAGRI